MLALARLSGSRIPVVLLSCRPGPTPQAANRPVVPSRERSRAQWQVHRGWAGQARPQSPRHLETTGRSGSNDTMAMRDREGPRPVRF